MTQIVYNAIQTPDGTVLESKHRHDYKTHVDANGETYMVDGGLDYRRTTVNKEEGKDLCLTLDDPHEQIREVVVWGTYGKDGKQKYKEIPVKSMTTDHIKAVVVLPYVHPNLKTVFNNELAYRGNA